MADKSDGPPNDPNIRRSGRGQREAVKNKTPHIKFVYWKPESVKTYKEYLILDLETVNRELDKAGGRIQLLLTINVAIIALMVPILGLMGEAKIEPWTIIAFVPLFASLLFTLYLSWSLRDASFMDTRLALDENWNYIVDVPRLLEDALLNALIVRYKKTLDALERTCSRGMLAGIILSISLAIFVTITFYAIWS